LSIYSFLDPGCSYELPASFRFDDYIETEQELWALFPETDGKRVNFVQIGLTATIYTEVFDDDSELESDQIYILMPCRDMTMRPIRMEAARRLTLSEYRMGHLTAVKLMGRVGQAAVLMREIGMEILGPEVMEEVESRLRDGRPEDESA
jgi:Fe-S-cluster formation regulator IscX/YfhJ